MMFQKQQSGPLKNVKLSDNKSCVYQESEEKRDSTWSAIFLPSTGILLVCLGITLIILGAIRGQADLIVLGIIFIAGSTVFFVLLYTVVCRPFCRRNQVDSSSYIDTSQSANTGTRSMSETFDDAIGQYTNQDNKRAKAPLVPRESVLYANDKSRSFLATPATTKDVNFNEGLDTPPPPRIALPHGVDGRSSVATPDTQDCLSYDFDPLAPPVYKSSVEAPAPAVYDEDIDKAKQNSEITTLELL